MLHEMLWPMLQFVYVSVEELISLPKRFHSNSASGKFSLPDSPDLKNSFSEENDVLVMPLSWKKKNRKIKIKR